MKQESLKAEYDGYREEYLPKKNDGQIKILFIAESPPAYDNEKELPYFYNKDAKGTGSRLWRYFNKALYDGEFSDKGEFLERFKNDGYYLIDIFQTEKELRDTETQVKKEDYTNAVRVSIDLFDRIRVLKPEKVVIIGKETAKLIAGCLPYGSNANVERFKKFIGEAKRAKVKEP